MAIRFTIKPEYDLLLYVFDGNFSGKDYFDAYEAVYKDSRRHHGMKVLMDLDNAEPEFDVHNYWEGVSLVRSNHEAGYDPDHVAISTSKSTTQDFAEVFKIMANDLPIHLGVFHNHMDAIRWLGLAEHETDVLRFWNEFKSAND